MLTTDGAGALTWQGITDIGGVTGTGTSTQLAYWDSTNSLTSSPSLSFNQTDLSVGANIVPTTDGTYNLGSSTNRFNDLYLAGNSIHLGEDGNEATVAYNTTENTMDIFAKNGLNLSGEKNDPKLIAQIKDGVPRKERVLL